MGGTSYSDDMYHSRITSAKSSSAGYFTHDSAIRSGKTSAGVHEKLDPSKKNSLGKLIRESFDSTGHPNSVPIAVLFDVTGSMSTVPRTFVSKLGSLMKLLVKKGYVADPQILFGAIGDATCDRVPLQIGQFESGNEMDEALSLIFLEGNGGGQQTESYELAMYYMARHTDLDSLNKRGKKGYLFLMGDETPYNEVKKSEVNRIIGDTLEANIPTPQILAELRQKFEVFWIIPGGTSNFSDSHVNKYLSNLFGQNLLKLQNPDDICELIASTIGLCEGYDLHDIKNDLVDVGSSAKSVDNALATVASFSKNLPAKKAKVDGKLLLESGDSKKKKKDTVERL
jgi:hypothetical protein